MRLATTLGLASLAIASPVAKRQNVKPQPPLHFFVFGDSYSSIESNVTSPAPSIEQPFGFPPVGTSPDDLTGNALIANTSTANGPNWVEFLTVRDNTTVTLTYDFAISGASIPDGLTDQVLNIYEPKYSSLFSGNSKPNQSTPPPSVASWSSNSSIFATWIGINDINWCSLLFTRTPDVPFSECLPPRMDSYFSLMENLYTTGARNFFFVNMPPLQRAPMVFEHGQKIIDNFAEGVELFNNHLLPHFVRDFTAMHPGSRAVVYDAHTFFSRILDNPTWYGFKDNKCYSCIGCYNVTGCFWSNNYHPVWQVHERLASDMIANLTSIGWPVLEFERGASVITAT